MTLDRADRWMLTFPGPAGCHGEQDTVVVEQQAGFGPHGHPVYADAARTVRVEIEDGGLVHVLDCVGRPVPDNPVHAQPLRRPPTSPQPRRGPRTVPKPTISP
ncbi:DUF6296 family protein [Kitasatospora sp. NPDC085895]|uniref:DUF6296 family protein n=1 Tax=Kitasatospora sp. NPDC085895 TaxID=3155057 RepID=UPI00344DE770